MHQLNRAMATPKIYKDLSLQVFYKDIKAEHYLHYTTCSFSTLELDYSLQKCAKCSMQYKEASGQNMFLFSTQVIKCLLKGH